MALLDAFLLVSLGAVCASCAGALETPTAGPVCDSCWRGIARLTPPVCRRCGLPLPPWRVISNETATCARCRRSRRAVARLWSLGPYEGRLRDIVHALKYGRHRSVAARLSAMLRSEAVDVLAGADCVVPVPLHWSRQWTRGFNQSAELARGLGLPIVAGLAREQRTASQATLSAAGRRANVRDAFAPRRGRAAARLAGSTVVLIDDVCTTGATLEACARVLLGAGAHEVRAITAARAVLGRR